MSLAYTHGRTSPVGTSDEGATLSEHSTDCVSEGLTSGVETDVREENL